MADFRALCAELADELQGYKVAHPMHCRALLNRARAALEAQPEPQGPTDEELKNLANKAWISVDVLKEYDLIENAFDCCGFARAVLTRWGRPAIQPVPVAERPWEREKGWRDLDGECWWCPPKGTPYWRMVNPAMACEGWLLPAHALPIPTSQKI